MLRFTNSASQPQADGVPDGRGLAIKVLDVEGELLASPGEGPPMQDFVMVNHPVFIARNALKDHQPLGGINRLRREVYPISAAWRRRKVS